VLFWIVFDELFASIKQIQKSKKYPVFSCSGQVVLKGVSVKDNPIS